VEAIAVDTGISGVRDCCRKDGGSISIMGAVVMYLLSLKGKHPRREPCSPVQMSCASDATSRMAVPASQSLLASRTISCTSRCTGTQMMAGSSDGSESWSYSDDRALAQYLQSSTAKPLRGRVQDMLHGVEGAWVLLFNPGMHNEGVYTLAATDGSDGGGSDGLLMFELWEDAASFAALLEADGDGLESHVPKACMKSASWISSFCERAIYVKKGCHLFPPANNKFDMDPNGWDAGQAAKMQLESFRSACEGIYQSPSSSGAPSGSAEHPSSFRPPFEGIYQSPSASGAPSGRWEGMYQPPSSSGDYASCWTRKGPPSIVFGGIEAAWVLILDGRSAHRWYQAATGETAILAFMEKRDADRYARALDFRQREGGVEGWLQPYVPTLIAGPQLISICEQDQQLGMLLMPGAVVTPP